MSPGREATQAPMAVARNRRRVPTPRDERIGNDDEVMECPLRGSAECKILSKADAAGRDRERCGGGSIHVSGWMTVYREPVTAHRDLANGLRFRECVLPLQPW